MLEVTGQSPGVFDGTFTVGGILVHRYHGSTSAIGIQRSHPVEGRTRDGVGGREISVGLRYQECGKEGFHTGRHFPDESRLTLWSNRPVKLYEGGRCDDLRFAVVDTVRMSLRAGKPEKPTWALQPTTYREEGLTVEMGEWFTAGGTWSIPKVKECGDDDCAALEAEGWMVKPYLAELVRMLECDDDDPGQCVELAYWERLMDSTGLVYEQKNEQGEWAYRATKCGDTWNGVRGDAVIRDRTSVRFPVHDAFLDTLRITVTGCE